MSNNIYIIIQFELVREREGGGARNRGKGGSSEGVKECGSEGVWERE